MDGIFQKNRTKTCCSILGLCAGLGLLLLTGVLAFSGGICTIEDAALMGMLFLWGLTMSSLCSRALWISHRVRLRVEGGQIMRVSSHGTPVCCTLEQLWAVRLSHSGSGLTLCLKAGEEYWFDSLQNCAQLKTFIDPQLTPEGLPQPNPKALLTQVRTWQKKRKGDIVGLVVSAGYMLLAPLATAMVAGQRALVSLAPKQWLLLGLLGILWVGSIVLLAVFLGRCSRHSSILDYTERCLHQN